MKTVCSVFVVLCVASCTPIQTPAPEVPALDYVSSLNTYSAGAAGYQENHTRAQYASAPQVSFAKDLPPDFDRGTLSAQPPMVSNMPGHGEPAYQEYRSSAPNVRPYQGPLALGDPGVSSSLWRESKAGNELFRDHRAYQPMDLVTIVVQETTNASSEADTEVGQESSILSGITNFFNFENDVTESNPGINTASLINAASTSEFSGEGDTQRRGSLTARISAMVVEVLPSGVMRIAGKKIVSVNSEEQFMVISGLIRHRDVNTNNEVDSSRIANLRVDYFGKGPVGDVQHGGWLGNFVRRYWPF